MSATNSMIRGSLIVFRRICGKPGCRCAGQNGILHATPALKCSVDGVSRLITLNLDPAFRLAAEWLC